MFCLPFNSESIPFFLLALPERLLALPQFVLDVCHELVISLVLFSRYACLGRVKDLVETFYIVFDLQLLSVHNAYLLLDKILVVLLDMFLVIDFQNALLLAILFLWSLLLIVLFFHNNMVLNASIIEHISPLFLQHYCSFLIFNGTRLFAIIFLVYTK